MTDNNEDTNPWPTSRAVEFMEELGTLCGKYGVTMSACNCCEGLNVDAEGGNVMAEVYASPGEWAAKVTTGDPYYKRERIESPATTPET